MVSMQTAGCVDEMAAAYERDGVVRWRGLLNPQRLAQVQAAMRRYIDEVLPTLDASACTREADGVAIRNLWHLEMYDPFFAELAADPRIVALVERLVHGKAGPGVMETFNKPARIGSGVPPHQDNAYFCQTPPDMLTVWIALDPATLQNGPIYYIRGSHKLGTLEHRPSGVKGNSMGLAAPFDNSDPFVGTLDAGDALIHHCQTIHYSAPNKTDQPRCGLLIVYRGLHTQTDPVLRANYAKGGAIPATP
jgi:ectoine hydroxylase-related dioxygenase (phytanoyl-CoA dioxygenase family)